MLTCSCTPGAPADRAGALDYRALTTRPLPAELPDVPAASLDRHVTRLAEHDVVSAGADVTLPPRLLERRRSRLPSSAQFKAVRPRMARGQQTVIFLIAALDDVAEIHRFKLSPSRAPPDPPPLFAMVNGNNERHVISRMSDNQLAVDPPAWRLHRIRQVFQALLLLSQDQEALTARRHPPGFAKVPTRALHERDINNVVYRARSTVSLFAAYFVAATAACVGQGCSGYGCWGDRRWCGCVPGRRRG